eukprot:6058195-Prymnesium_polylepis.2
MEGERAGGLNQNQLGKWQIQSTSVTGMMMRVNGTRTVHQQGGRACQGFVAVLRQCTPMVRHATLTACPIRRRDHRPRVAFLMMILVRIEDRNSAVGDARKGQRCPRRAEREERPTELSAALKGARKCNEDVRCVEDKEDVLPDGPEQRPDERARVERGI